MKQVETTINECVEELQTSRHETAQIQEKKRYDALFDALLKVLCNPDRNEFDVEAHGLLLKEAQRDTGMAGILRACGYVANKKFAADFDMKKACETTLFHKTPFLDMVQASFKRGNGINISMGNPLAWKDVFREDLHEYTGSTCFNAVLSCEDLMDAMEICTAWKTSLLSCLNGKHKRLLPGRVAKMADEAQIKGLKRKLSDLSTSGESSASAALEKMVAIEEDKASTEDTKSKARKAKNKKRRVAHRICKYSRKPGDELRLLRKREIVTWSVHEFQYRFLSVSCTVILQ